MEQLYFGLSVGLSLATGAVAGLMLRAPVSRYLAERRRQRELDDLFAATNRQIALERLQQRRELYLSFRNAAAAMVEELADGGGRWATFYLARDLLRDINSRGAPDVALAARQMCFVCQVMLNNGFSDELSVKFDQALHRFEAACRDDLSTGEEVPAWPLVAGIDAESPTAARDAQENPSESQRRRYFHVLR